MIRQGFVSNSSSSSFIIRVPEDKLEFDQILDYYKVNKELSPKFRAWLNLIIDYILEQPLEADDDYYDNNLVKEEYEVPYLLRDHYKEYFKDRFPHGDLTEEEIEAVRLKALESFKENNWLSFYIEDYGNLDFYDLNIPYRISSKLGEECYNIFTDPSVAMAERC
jgi:hypothetical protein